MCRTQNVKEQNFVQKVWAQTVEGKGVEILVTEGGQSAELPRILGGGNCGKGNGQRVHPIHSSDSTICIQLSPFFAVCLFVCTLESDL